MLWGAGFYTASISKKPKTSPDCRRRSKDVSAPKTLNIASDRTPMQPGAPRADVVAQDALGGPPIQ